MGGMMKQFHKASQYMSEKMGGESDKTKMDEEFVEMERKVDLMAKAVSEIMTHTKEYLQPNPTTRAKMNMMNISSKIQGKQRDMKYPQTESILADTMLKFGGELGETSNFGDAMVEIGESLRQLSEIKDSLDVGVKQDFLDPLQQLLDKDIKEVMHHRKKLSGRRLDYDYKRKKGTKVPQEEIVQAEQKLEESLELADNSMFNLLSGDVEQVSQLAALVEAQVEYHRQSTDILETLHEKLQERITNINSQPPRERKSRSSGMMSSMIQQSGGDLSQDQSPVNTGPNTPKITSDPLPPIPVAAPPQQPSVRGLYLFEAENDGELGFKEGEILTLISQIDENWYEGMNDDGDTGYFPVSFVEVLVPLPN